MKIALTFGRMNCPTIGHGRLLDALQKANPSDYRVFLSKTVDPKKNPLTYDEKMKFAREMFPKHRKAFVKHNGKTLFDVLTDLHSSGVTEIVFVVGSDRVPEFEKLIPQYNGVEGRHGFYDFKSIEIRSAGERDPDADGAEGMSASKMRAAVQENDRESFNLGLPKGYNGDELWKAMRKGMKLEETCMIPSFKQFLSERALSQDTRNILKSIDRIIDHFDGQGSRSALVDELENIRMAVEEENNSDEVEVLKVLTDTLKDHRVRIVAKNLGELITKLPK